MRGSRLAAILAAAVLLGGAAAYAQQPALWPPGNRRGCRRPV